MNLLLSRPDRLGDVVLTTPLVGALRATPGVQRIVFLGRETWRPLVEQAVDTYLAIEDPATLSRLQSLRMDASLHLNPHRTAAKLARAAGIPRRIGYLSDGDDLTEAIPDPRPLGKVHETAAGWELVKRLGLALPVAPGRPAVAVAARPDLTPKLGAPVLAVHVGASPGKARLPESLLHAVAAAWLQKPGARVVWLGDTNEYTIASRMQSGLDPDRSIMACGKLTLPELAGVAGAATVFLGRDSGPAHLAAAAGGNVVVVIPAARADMSVIRWRPPGDRVTVIECDGRARWWEKTERASTRLLAALSPSCVISAVEAAAERAIRPDTVSSNRKNFA